MNITEKILAAHSGKERVVPGELITVKLDRVLNNDLSIPISVRNIKEMGFSGLFDKEKVIFVLDHFVPNATVKAAQQSKAARDYAKQQGMPYFYDVGAMGIEHALLPELGLVLPGQLIIGADSHTCTYGALGAFSTGMGSTDISGGMATGELWLKVPESLRFVYNGALPKWITGKDLILYTIGQIGVDGALYKSMEFCGSAIEQLPMDGRFTMCNMAIEAGAKNGIIAPDVVTLAYVEAHNLRKDTFEIYKSDLDAHYAQTYQYDVSRMEPQVACPHLPSNVHPISDIKDVSIDQVVIGSCTNGRIEDLRAAAEVFRGNKVTKYVRTLIIPGTQAIYRQAMQEGLIDIFLDAGAAVSTPTCGPCFGGHMGLLAEGERAVSTTNRNFVGRMGHPKSEVYLSSPYVAAAAAVSGELIHPKEVCHGEGT